MLFPGEEAVANRNNTLLISATYNEADGDPECAASVTFCAAALANLTSFYWRVSGSGYINGQSNINCVSVTSQRSYYSSSSYTVSVTAYDGQGQAWYGSRSWDVQAEYLCD
ncbi:hypothetical protein AB9P05_12575 [Roseivirga sp. BDSF3-8]|uniref:hypothetical protein n=1 Tax=Roseivirga sp. BDSF3-8 TaxID=3241598 RepID=UPI0035321A31